MRFGLFYEHQMPRPWAEGDEERLLLDALEQIELADRVGIDYVWEVEHHFLEEYSHSSAPEVFLAAASQRTRNIRLGHGIVQLPPAINHPARIAERAATLDLVSGGRLDLGTGEGSSQVELGGFGVPREAKREHWEEALEVLVRMLTEDPFTGHQGTWVDVPPRNVIPKPKQKPHPPLWVACSRRETIELAARRGIGALSFSFVDPDDAKPWVDAYYRIITSEECVPAGLSVNPNVAVVLPFMCHEDEETAIERGIDGAHFFGYSLAHYYVFGDHVPGHTVLWDEFEKYRHERGFAREIIKAEKEPLGMKVLEAGVGSLRGAVGTPEQITDLLRRYEAVGVDQVIFVSQAGRNRHEHICESIELFAEQVLPQFAEGRDEEEAAKRERLTDAAERALARRGTAPRRDVSSYVVTPQGEMSAAPNATPVRGRPIVDADAVRDRVRDGIRGAMAAFVRKSDDERLERVATSPLTLRILFNGMAQSVRADRAGELDTTLRWEVESDGTIHPWTIRVKDGRGSAREGAVGEADATLRISATDFVKMMSGELPAGKAIMDERLVITGDLGAVSRFTAATGESALY